MSAVTLRYRLGTLLRDHPRLAWTVWLPGLARRLGRSWMDFHNRGEELAASPDDRGFDCRWEWTSDLNVCRAFPTVADRLAKWALAEWPIELAQAGVARGAENPDVSVIIGHRGSDKIPHLLTTIRSVLGQKGCSVECVVVEQAFRPILSDRLPAGVRYLHTPPPTPDMKYARAWAFNCGARAARGRILVFHDNDVLIPAGYARELVRLADRGFQAMRLHRLVFYLTAAATSDVQSRGSLPDHFALDCARQNCEGHSLAVERDTYFAIGGHDESFIGWGGEDNEMFDRCRSVKLYPFGYLPMLHLYHTPQVRPTDPERFLTKLRERMAIPPRERAAELARRPFGRPEGPGGEAAAADEVCGPGSASSRTG